MQGKDVQERELLNKTFSSGSMRHQSQPTRKAAFGGSKQFTWYNLGICFLISLGQLAFGYNASIISTTMGQPSFLLYMKLVDPETFLPTSTASSIEGAMSGIFFVRPPSPANSFDQTS